MKIHLNITPAEAEAIRQHLTAHLVGGSATQREQDVLCSVLLRVLRSLPKRKAKETPHRHD